MIFLALERYRVPAMSSSEGSKQPIIFSADLMTLCKAFCSADEQPAYHAVRPYVMMLSMAEL